MTKKIRLGVLCGGQSAEHEVSIISAKNVLAALDKKKYRLRLVYITKQGEWFLFHRVTDFLKLDQPEKQLKKHADLVAMTLGEKGQALVTLDSGLKRFKLDVVFPVLHGPNGEDGTVQGLLKLANIPCVGPGVLSSAMAMDKDITKRLLRESGLPSANWLTFHRRDRQAIKFSTIKKKLGLPFFVKPANMGSSVGMTKVKRQQDFDHAIQLAFEHDAKIIIEQAINGRELECAVLGNDKPRASAIAEIIPTREFYDYEAKYIDPNGAKLIPGVQLPSKVEKQLQRLAIQAFKVLDCQGMARVDFFFAENGDIYVNEVNTIPGFTQISMYPQLWQISGISYPELVDQLIHLAITA